MNSPHLKLLGMSVAAGCALALLSPVTASAAPIINEFVADHTGTDTNEFVEIFGDPNTDYSAHTIVEIEGDGATTGLVDDFILNAGTTDANGFWVSPFQNNVIENGNITLLLVTGWTGAVGNDIDTDNNGVIDTTFWTSIIDSVGVLDAATAGMAYGQTNLGGNFDGLSTFEPGGASRIPNGTDTNSVSDWKRNAFDPVLNTPLPGEAYNTPGATNRWVPEPSSLTLITVASLVVLGVRRRTQP